MSKPVLSQEIEAALAASDASGVRVTQQELAQRITALGVPRDQSFVSRLIHGRITSPLTEQDRAAIATIAPTVLGERDVESIYQQDLLQGHFGGIPREQLTHRWGDVSVLVVRVDQESGQILGVAGAVVDDLPVENASKEMGKRLPIHVDVSEVVATASPSLKSISISDLRDNKSSHATMNAREIDRAVQGVNVDLFGDEFSEVVRHGCDLVRDMVDRAGDFVRRIKLDRFLSAIFAGLAEKIEGETGQVVGEKGDSTPILSIGADGSMAALTEIKNTKLSEYISLGLRYQVLEPVARALFEKHTSLSFVSLYRIMKADDGKLELGAVPELFLDRTREPSVAGRLETIIRHRILVAEGADVSGQTEKRVQLDDLEVVLTYRSIKSASQFSRYVIGVAVQRGAKSPGRTAIAAEVADKFLEAIDQLQGGINGD